MKAALTFAESTGVRLVIKNTGHDYIGRSSAPDSLTLLVSNRALVRRSLPDGLGLDEEIERSELLHPTGYVQILIQMQITYSESFLPEGCKTTAPGVTMGVSLLTQA